MEADRKDMSFIEKEIIVPGLQNTYRILHITDSHIVAMDHREEGYIIEGGPHKGKFLTDFGKLRYEHFTYDGETTAQRFSDLCDAIRNHPDCADAIVFTGDILDFFTESAFDFMCENLKKLPIPYIFTLGNHDMIFSKRREEEVRGIFLEVCGGNTELQKYKLGELALIGIDNTRNYYTDEALNDLYVALAGEQHAVLFQHIPLSTNGYHEFSMAAGPKDWSLGNEGICIGDSWKKVFGLIEAEDTKIRALVCGDGHMEHESSIGGITQFVSPLGAKYPPVRFTVHA